ncbi:MAG: hypothetical protein ACTSR8_08875 [Promethearchaeota archaeon]
MTEKVNSVENLPAKFSIYTLSGIVIISIGILLGYFYNKEMGFTFGLLGLIFILFNSYLRELLQSDANIKMINPKVLTLFWVGALALNYVIFQLPYTIIFLGFTMGLVLRIFNIIMHKLEKTTQKIIDKKKLILLIISSASLFFVAFFPICSIVQNMGSGGIYIDISWTVANVVGFIVYILFLSVLFFPVITGFDYLLNCDDPKEENKKFTISGIKSLLLIGIIFILYFLGILIETMPIVIYIQIGAYFSIISGASLIISGQIGKKVDN